MKTKILSFALLTSLTLVIAGCGKKAGPLSCAADTVRYSEDISAFVSNQTKGNCEAVKKSIDKLYKSCTSFAAADRADYEEFQNDFNCDDYK
jgi:apolipoprotein N-acyltransferase